MQRLRGHEMAEQEVEIRDDPEAGIEAAVFGEQGAVVEDGLMGKVVAAAPELHRRPGPVHEAEHMALVIDEGDLAIDDPMLGKRRLEMKAMRASTVGLAIVSSAPRKSSQSPLARATALFQASAMPPSGSEIQVSIPPMRRRDASRLSSVSSLEPPSATITSTAG